jgi:hypothetical protein
MTTVDKTAILFHAMSLPDLIAFQSCPLELQDYFEQVMMEKYGIMEAME